MQSNMLLSKLISRKDENKYMMSMAVRVRKKNRRKKSLVIK